MTSVSSIIRSIIRTPEYIAGLAAYELGGRLRDNPYPIGSEPHFRWQEGFLGNCHPERKELQRGE